MKDTGNLTVDTKYMVINVKELDVHASTDPF